MMLAFLLILVVLVAGFLAVTVLWAQTFKDGARLLEAVKKPRSEP